MKGALSESVEAITKMALSTVADGFVQPHQAVRMLSRLSNRIGNYIETYREHSEIQSERKMLEWSVAARHFVKDFQTSLAFFDITEHPQVQIMVALCTEESPGLKRRTDDAFVEEFRE